MKNAERYFKSTQIILDGYENETLSYNNWGGCVDGHLIAGNMGYSILPLTCGRDIIGMGWQDNGRSVPGSFRDWGKLLKARNFLKRKILRSDIGKERYQWACQCLTTTGYTKKELREIMRVFEKCYDDENEFRNIVTGLKAVLAKLKQIHAVSEKDMTVIYRKAFDRERERLEGFVDEVYPSILRFQQDCHFNYKAYIQKKQAEVTYAVLEPGSGMLLAAS